MAHIKQVLFSALLIVMKIDCVEVSLRPAPTDDKGITINSTVWDYSLVTKYITCLQQWETSRIFS